MNFVTFQFVVFFCTTVLLFLFIPHNQRKYFLLVCSYFFYGSWSVPLIGVILFSTSVDYYLGHKIYRSSSQLWKKRYLIISIVINCSILIYFKYTNFLLETANALGDFLGYTQVRCQFLDIILPLGVSFYTFEAISYIVDIYRGEKPASSWLNYNFYIMYFPHLISGPIVRYQELHSQYETSISLPESSRLKEGFRLVLYGFIFKLIVADSAASISDPLFEQYQTLNHLQSWLASIAFTLQIYFDFLGYTHIARGVSLFFNIRLPLNFNHPYNARTISEFWQRWHMSLSLWIRDYLYIPLGGNRGKLYQTVTYLMITMFIAGLWHGASWNYAIWGLYHACLLSIYHLVKSFRKNKPGCQGKWSVAVSTGLTFSCVVIGWVLFRATSLDQACTILLKMSDVSGFIHEIMTNQQGSQYSDAFLLLVSMIILCFSGPFIEAKEQQLLKSIEVLWIKKVLYSCSLMTVLVFMFSPIKPFIYFVF